MVPIRQVSVSSLEHRPPPSLGQWTAECMADADSVRIEPPPGHRVPRQLERELAHVRRIVATGPSNVAAAAVAKLLREVADWQKAPVDVTEWSCTVNQGDVDILITEVVIGMAED